MANAEIDALVDRYVEALQKVGEPVCSAYELGRATVETLYPLRHETNPGALQRLYATLGLTGFRDTRFPILYESLILRYRWEKIDAGAYTLTANPPGDTLAELAQGIGRWDTVRPNGYLAFAQGPSNDYDPVCFDFRNRQRNGDCRIVKLDHEAILCDDRIVEVSVLAPNLRSLMLATITSAEAAE
jgi:hypothetical protein